MPTPPHRYNGVQADVWALGASLYLMVYGCLPYEAPTTHMLFERLKSDELAMPEEPATSKECVAFLRRLLHKDPATRAHLDDVAVHEWLTRHGDEPLPFGPVQKVAVSSDDVEKALSVSGQDAWAKARMKFTSQLAKVHTRKSVTDASRMMFMVGEVREEIVADGGHTHPDLRLSRLVSRASRHTRGTNLRGSGLRSSDLRSSNLHSTDGSFKQGNSFEQDDSFKQAQRQNAIDDSFKVKQAPVPTPPGAGLAHR
jgi:serine/threonine protein kinase